MQTDTTEYLPNATENGHSNGQPKKFGLHPMEDPDKQIVYQIRKQCHEDRELGFGARFYFSYLLDRATDNRTWSFRGAVLISVKKLRLWLGCSRRVVYSWNAELVKRRYIWISKVSLSANMDPFNMYHITALNPPKGASQKLAHDGMWGSETPRPRVSVAPGIGGRDGKWRAENATEKIQNPPLFAETALGSSKEGHAAVEEIATASSSIDDSEPQSMRLPVAEIAASSRKKCASPSQKRALITHTVIGSTGMEGTESLETQQLKAPKRVPRGPGSGALAAKAATEKDFLERVGKLVGVKAMANYGGWYRNRFREDKDKAWRVHDELARMNREGEISSNPGGCFKDLWGRFA